MPAMATDHEHTTRLTSCHFNVRLRFLIRARAERGNHCVARVRATIGFI